MNSLPALTTVRPSPRPAAATPAPVAPPVPQRVAAVEVPGLPPAARQFLGELLRAGLVADDALPGFFERLGPRLRELTTRERLADALVGLNVVSRYAATRALAGQSHGLAFGNYRVLERLDSGSVGVVYRGEHPLLGRPVAIKAVTLSDGLHPEAVVRFFREARALGRLDHPNVVRVHDAGRVAAADGQPGAVYLVMDLVPGGDLENHVYKSGAASLAVAAGWGRQAARALAACHAAGVIHRDVKPSNLLLSASGGVVLIDFGLARDFASTLTGPRMLVGSVEFLAPEQLADAATAAEPADVYALGATLFWALTGQLPYPQAAKVSDAIAAIQAGPPRRLREVAPELPAALDLLLTRMLSRQPGGRPTAAQVAAELGAFAGPDAAPDDALRHAEGAARAATLQATQARHAVVAALAAAAAVRPGESAAHQRRIAGVTRILAGTLAASPEWVAYADPRAVAALADAATLHDLGLVATPDEVVAAGSRSASDRHAYEQHPVQGEAILDALGQSHGDALPFLRQAKAVARHHHEHYDGTGFPDRLAGERIPAGARVVAVAVAYEDYRRTHPPADAAVMVRVGARRLYDPAVVEAFVAAQREVERLFAELYDADLVPEPPIELPLSE